MSHILIVDVTWENLLQHKLIHVQCTRKSNVQGGACYNHASFFNWVDCTGETPELGKRLYVFDVTDEQRGWASACLIILARPTPTGR
jgi:hypothetical protein